MKSYWNESYAEILLVDLACREDWFERWGWGWKEELSLERLHVSGLSSQWMREWVPQEWQIASEYTSVVTSPLQVLWPASVRVPMSFLLSDGQVPLSGASISDGSSRVVLKRISGSLLFIASSLHLWWASWWRAGVWSSSYLLPLSSRLCDLVPLSWWFGTNANLSVKFSFSTLVRCSHVKSNASSCCLPMVLICFGFVASVDNLA